MTSPSPSPVRLTSGIELNGLDIIDETERHGQPRDLFWPWFAANVSVLGLSYGSFLLGFGVSFWQASLIGVVGIVISFLFCGFVAAAGKRGSAPTMVLSRAAFGVNGNRLISVISWLLTVGWEIVLASLAVLATARVFEQFGWDSGVSTKIVALIIVATLIVVAGVAGFPLIMRLQSAITVATALLTVTYILLVLNRIDLASVGSLPTGSTAAMIGGLVFMMTGFGLGWVNAAADYSRYLPRSTRTGDVVAWTTFGGAAAPVILVVVGLLLAASSAELSAAIAIDPIGALASILPTWFLLPFIVVALLGLIGGAVMDIYSSGLALLSAGLTVSRPVAAGIDGVLMVLGTVYVVFIAGDFLGPFQGFLITLGVPIAGWLGVFLADLLLRRRDYDREALYHPRGRYGSVSVIPLTLVLVGVVLGWGLVVNSSPGFEWEGYLLGPIGGREGEWASSNLGVLVTLVIGFVGALLCWRPTVRRQEAQP
ncbi:purine-cytosine permease family protein [Rathayibacter toxicus]|uniref:Allantoin permease n=1 Tax=Rathayibacter toxicus TaxID=145458 RepID=A0A0C5BDH0_9MICO|nr:cytosine permease [Rathayibacter toxicus]AJM77276.1 allantoin permease [Rathayibacter toxicus]ALS56857.1 allantoin permease [Rathayibacter toxicus]KKM46301.1 allantoin permease [Rathayibacter toxicus]PPG23273.1 allantoin permease [Rathayibacter toxicus]PPG47856.1 allantoin permease [Rathayibacter toxicus]